MSKNPNKHSKKHHNAINDNKEEYDGSLEFDWVILRIGNGHFEKNMCKTFVELNWDVFFSELCRVRLNILMGKSNS